MAKTGFGPQFNPKWRPRMGKVSMDYIQDTTERRKSRNQRKRTLCTKASELVSRCGGEVFLQYRDGNQRVWTYCSSDALYAEYQDKGLHPSSDQRLDGSGRVSRPNLKFLLCKHETGPLPEDTSEDSTLLVIPINATDLYGIGTYEDHEDEFLPKKKAKIDDSNEPEQVGPGASASSSTDKTDDLTDPGISEEVLEELADSPQDVKENIKQKFLVKMPEDFYDFWEFAKSINSKNPQDAFKASLDLQLVGPYDLLAGKSVRKNKKGGRPCYLRHWRYYYDPPEFMTVLRGDDSTQFHMGYFRDDPKEMPVFVASNAAKENCNIMPRGENLFAAVQWAIENLLRKVNQKASRLKELKEKLVEWAQKAGHPLEQKTKAMKARDKKANCKTFHGAGMVVPVDQDEVGYREVPETPGDLKKMLKKIIESKDEDDRNVNFDPLMEIIMLVQFANDECDYGEGLELGLDLFSYGGEVLHSTILNLMPLAYEFLERNEYADIIRSHLADRKHTADLSEFD